MSYGEISVKGVGCDSDDCLRQEPWNQDDQPNHQPAPPFWLVRMALPPGGMMQYFCPSCSEKMLAHVGQ